MGGASTIVFHAPLSLLCYEAIYALKDNQVLQPAIQHLSIPGLAALSTAILTHPLDSIRKRCMVTHLGLKVDNPNAAKVAIKPLSQVFGELKAFGYSTPFQGMSLTLLRTIFAAAFIAAKRRPEYKQLERMPN